MLFIMEERPILSLDCCDSHRCASEIAAICLELSRLWGLQSWVLYRILFRVDRNTQQDCCCMTNKRENCAIRVSTLPNARSAPALRLNDDAHHQEPQYLCNLCGVGFAVMKRRTFISLAPLMLSACGVAARESTPVPATALPPTATRASAVQQSATEIPAAAAVEPATQLPTAQTPPTLAPTALPPTQAPRADLPVGPLAQPIRSDTWLNSPPLEWDALRGKVVMVEFWTFG
jgi:hypothetical protein